MNKTYHINFADLQKLIEESQENLPALGFKLQGFVFTPSQDRSSDSSTPPPPVVPEFYLSPVYTADDAGAGPSGQDDIIRINTKLAGACPYPPGYGHGQKLIDESAK